MSDMFISLLVQFVNKQQVLCTERFLFINEYQTAEEKEAEDSAELSY